MFTKNKILIAVVVIVLVGAGVWLGQNLNKGGEKASPYSVVAMSNGEILFGKLSWFPSPHLKDGWTIQQSKDDKNQVGLSLVPLTSAIWKPVGEIYLNPAQMISWARLSAESDLVKTFENPSAAQQGSQAPPGATSTFRGPSAQPPGQ